MKSSTASIAFGESTESFDRNRSDSASYAAFKWVSLSLDLGIVDDDPPDALRRRASQKTYAFQEELHQFLDEAPVGKKERSAPSAEVAEGVGLAHDAGNLLSALHLYSELLSVPGVLHDDYREYAAELRLLSKRSSAMISRLFDHVHQAKGETSCRLTSLTEVITGSGGLLNRIAGRRVEISFDRGADRLVEVSAEVVERIITNLVKNAAEAIGDDSIGSISVHVTAAGVGQNARVAVIVSDTGCGMTRAEVASLGAYEKSCKARHGVGLRVVRELAAMSGGCIAIASAPGEGTKVLVEWPSIEQIEIGLGTSTKRVVRGEAGWIAC